MTFSEKDNDIFGFCRLKRFPDRLPAIEVRFDFPLTVSGNPLLNFRDNRLGRFRSPEDLLGVKGIKGKRLRKILPFLAGMQNN